MICSSARLLGLMAAGCTVVATVLLPPSAACVEIGFDVGTSVQWPDSASHSDFAFAIPGYEGGARTSLQTIRVGIALNETAQVEFAPGAAVTSQSYGGRGRLTIGQYTMALSYLLGRVRGEGPMPYLRAGGLASLKTIKDPFGYTSTTQFGTSFGVGVRWAKGDVFGIRSEIRATRLLPGDDTLEPGIWEVSLRGGVSAFTR